LKTLNHVECGAETNGLINTFIDLLLNLYNTIMEYGTIYYKNANSNILKTIDIVYNRVVNRVTNEHFEAVLFKAFYLMCQTYGEPLTINLFEALSPRKHQQNHHISKTH